MMYSLRFTQVYSSAIRSDIRVGLCSWFTLSTLKYNIKNDVCACMTTLLRVCVCVSNNKSPVSNLDKQKEVKCGTAQVSDFNLFRKGLPAERQPCLLCDSCCDSWVLMQDSVILLPPVGAVCTINASSWDCKQHFLSPKQDKQPADFLPRNHLKSYVHTHTHTHTLIYIYTPILTSSSSVPLRSFSSLLFLLPLFAASGFDEPSLLPLSSSSLPFFSLCLRYSLLQLKCR